MGDFTFSEHGEDILVHRLLLWKQSGFYIDCGAYHPRKMSLTARLRAFGWKGINVDADSRVIDLFNTQCSDQVNINAALTAKPCQIQLRRYEDPVINTVSEEQATHLDSIDSRGELFTSVLDTVEVNGMTLEQIVDENNVSNVDFLNLDIEGSEMDAIEGFPWGKLVPSVIACEIHRLNLYAPGDNEIVNKLTKLGYILQSYVFHTAIFMRNDFDTELCHRVSFKTL